MNEFLPLIIEHEGEALTTSRAIAEHFGKRHKDILKAIENLLADGEALGDERKIAPNSSDNNGRKIAPVKNEPNRPNFGGVNGLNFQPVEPESNPRNFEPVDIISGKPAVSEFLADNFRLSEYTDAKGEQRKQYIITKNGFTLLAMGFTGAKALQFKIAYINAFDRMERLIHGLPLIGSNLAESPQALTGAAQTNPLEKECALFIEALVNALNAGEYTIMSRRTPRGSDPVNTIGEYSGTSVLIAYKPAVKLYRAYSRAALNNEALKAALVSTGRAAKHSSDRADERAAQMNIHSIRGRRVSAVELIRGRNPALDEYLRNIDR